MTIGMRFNAWQLRQRHIPSVSTPVFCYSIVL